MGLLGEEGEDLPLQLASEKQPALGSKVLEIKQAQQEFVFTQVEQRPVPSLLRNFSAPVKLNYPYQLEDLSLLIQHDTDMVARWEAGQKFEIELLLNLVAAQQHQRSMQLPPIWTETFSQLLADKSIDLHLLTRLLTLPADNYLAQFSKPVAVEAIHRAREFAKQKMATDLENQFLAIYHHMLDGGAYVYNTQEMGRRSVKNLCLHYLVYSGKEKYADLAVEQFKVSNNMTDAMGALWALNDYPGEQRDQVLNEFYQKWRNQPLVVNKWLLLQASSKLPDTLEKVQALLKHPAFSLMNPNNVYNLLGGFAANMIHFHNITGSGYQFIADQVIAIDPKNPQVAARLVEPLTRWQNYEDKRQQLLRKQLERIKANPGISNDVYELVTKSLEQKGGF